jgi:hypothetical protein
MLRGSARPWPAAMRVTAASADGAGRSNRSGFSGSGSRCVAGRERLDGRRERRLEARVEDRRARRLALPRPARGGQRFLEGPRVRKVRRNGRHQDPRDVAREAHLVEIRQGKVEKALVPGLGGDDTLAGLEGQAVGRPVRRVRAPDAAGLERAANRREIGQQERGRRAVGPPPRREQRGRGRKVQRGEGEHEHPRAPHAAAGHASPRHQRDQRQV